MEIVLAAAVTAIGAIIVARINRNVGKKVEGMGKKVDGMDEKVAETHRMVTVNHHSSRAEGKPDTVLDHLADLTDLVKAQGSLMAEHIRHAEYRDGVNDQRFERIEGHIFKN